MMAKERSEEQNSSLATLEEMKTAIETSGYMLEGRIARLMAERGFYVETNAFVTDSRESTETIELDVTGRYLEWVKEANQDMVTASVLVECKNNAQPFAFFTRRQQLTELNDNRIYYGGFPSFSLDRQTSIRIPLHKLLETKDWHHYCQTNEVATQFCTFTRSGKKFKAGPNENYSKSFSKLAVVTASDSASGYALHLQCIQVQVSYPVAVFQGPIYRVEDENGNVKIEAVNRLQLHHSAIVDGRVIQVQIDVVTESAFPQLMEEILEELKTFRDKIAHLYPRLLSSALDQKRVALKNAAGQAFPDVLPPAQ